MTKALDSFLEWCIVPALFVVPLVAGVVPRFVKAAKYPKLFTALSCISAGVFLSLLLCHVIPEAVEEQLNFSHPLSAGDAIFFQKSHSHSHGGFFGSFVCGLVYLTFLVVDGIYGHSMLDEGSNSAHCHHHHHHEHVHGDKEGGKEQNISSFRAFLFVAILSLHSALEGFMKIGSELFWGMLLHKVLEIFAIGASLMQTKLKAWVYFLLVVFSAALTPLTQLLFRVMEKNLEETPTRDAVFIMLNALSSGAICFATFGECIPHEIEKATPSLSFRMGFILFGYIGTSLIGAI